MPVIFARQQGVEPASFDWMKRWVARFDGKQVDKLEVLLMLSFTPDALRTRVPLKKVKSNPGSW
jgi:hypothetical protein